MKLVIHILILVVAIYLINSQDLVKNLPSYPYQGRMFSGYLNLENSKKKLHYLFLESERDPEKDPLVLWLNGGPGCSSLLGWAQEHGPATMKDGEEEFGLNPYSWNKVANMIYLESPAGVGFSYINSKKDSDLYIDDFVSGKENLEALLDFFQRFPQYMNNELYISGESYAGIYVPTLVSNILEYNKGVISSRRISLTGFIVGNGVTDWKVDCDAAIIDFAYSHALYSPELRKEYTDNCINVPDKNKCNPILAQIMQSVSSVNIYDIYRKCYPSKDLNNNYTPWLFKGKFDFTQNINQNFLTYLEDNNSSNLSLTPPCVDSYGVNKYFNREDVKIALNVRTDINWSLCDADVGSRYKKNESGSIYLYPKLINSGLRILIYSGDTDGAVPVNGTRTWIKNLNLNITSPWRPWKIDSKSSVAGYRTIYDRLTFVTVKGTGHMVPQWKPKEAFYMISNFLDGKDL